MSSAQEIAGTADELRPTVSVVIPTFNRERWLPRSIGSVQAQSFPDWELLVVDDGSTDSSWKLLEQLAAGDPRIRPLKNARTKGVSGARNTGIDAARGEFVAFLDSDDEWLPEHLADSVAALLSPQRHLDGVTSVAERRNWDAQEKFGRAHAAPPVADPSAGAVGAVDGDKIFDLCLNGKCPLEVQTLVVRRSAVQEQRFPEDLRMCEDVFFFMLALRRGLRIGWMSDVHVTMWAHDANTTTAGGRQMAADERVRMYEAVDLMAKRVMDSFSLAPDQLRRVRLRRAEIRFWQIGYAGHLQAGRFQDAWRSFQIALQLDPWNLRFRRTALTSWLKHAMGLPWRQRDRQTEAESLRPSVESARR